MKKGQLDYPIITFVAVVIGTLILSIVIMKITDGMLTPMAQQLGNQSVESGLAITHVQQTFIGFWDWILIMFLLANIIMLFISAFLIDTHPAFILLYIIFSILTFIITPALVDVVDTLFNADGFAQYQTAIPMMDFFRVNFMLILIGVYMLTGIIIYAKFKWGGQQLR